MAFCDRCGSSSRDSEGFCGGCGAPISVEEITAPSESVGVKQQESSSQKPVVHIPFFTLVPPASKSVWAAGLLTLFLGPMGMIYSTKAGFYVMSAVSIVLSFSAKGWIPWLVFWPACIFWAVMAARD
jgi:hypothetical protein